MQLVPRLCERTCRAIRRRTLLSVLALLACRAPDAPSAVKIGYLPILADLPFFVAMENGAFSRNGLTVEAVRFESSPDMGTALLNGSIDAAASISTTVLLSIESRDPAKIRIFAVDGANATKYLSSVVVLGKSGIDSMQKLRGKKIGSFPGPGAGTFGKLVLAQFGMTEGKDYTWVELAAANQLAALSTGTVDALFTYEPIATQAVLEKAAIKLLPGAVESTVITPWQAGVWVFPQALATKRPVVAERIVKAIYEAIDSLRTNESAARRYLRKYTSIDSMVAANSVIHPFTKLGEVDVVTLQKNADILRDRHVLSRRIIVDSLFYKRLSP